MSNAAVAIVLMNTATTMNAVAAHPAAGAGKPITGAGLVVAFGLTALVISAFCYAMADSKRGPVISAGISIIAIVAGTLASLP